MKIKPKSNIVQVEPLKDIRTKTDIVYQEGEEEKDLIVGKIVTLGYGVTKDVGCGVDKDVGYKAGDIIIYGRYSAFPLIIKSVKYYLLPIEDILGTVEGLKDEK